MAKNIEQHSSLDISSLLLLPLRYKLLASPSFFPSLSSLLQFDPSIRPFRSVPILLPCFHLIRFPFETMSRFRICPLRQRDVYIRGGRGRGVDILRLWPHAWRHHVVVQSKILHRTVLGSVVIKKTFGIRPHNLRKRRIES